MCLVNVLKCDFVEVDEAMFLFVERHFERIFYILGMQKKKNLSIPRKWLSRWKSLITHHLLLGVLKNDFGDVDEAIFHGVERPKVLTLCFLRIEKSNLYEFA
jgi:hypothetical protein